MAGSVKIRIFRVANRPESRTARRHALLKIKVKALFEVNNAECGYRQILAALVRGGEAVDDETVSAQIMRELGLEACQPKPWRHSLTEQDGSAGPIPDLVNRDFKTANLAREWCGDITYVDTWGGWVFLATVIDCATRKIVGWAMDDDCPSPRSFPVPSRWPPVISIYRKGQSSISDRGSNYTSAEFGEVLENLGIKRSVGRTGICV